MIDTWKIQLSGIPAARNSESSMCRFWISNAIAYIEMPLENTVMIANRMAFSPRVFSSKRSRRNSGTERAFDP